MNSSSCWGSSSFDPQTRKRNAVFVCSIDPLNSAVSCRFDHSERETSSSILLYIIGWQWSCRQMWYSISSPASHQSSPIQKASTKCNWTTKIVDNYGTSSNKLFSFSRSNKNESFRFRVAFFFLCKAYTLTGDRRIDGWRHHALHAFVKLFISWALLCHMNVRRRR